MPRTASVILSAGERRSKVAALKRECSVVSKTVKTVDKEIKVLTRETTSKLKDLEKSRAAAQKLVDKINADIASLLAQAQAPETTAGDNDE